VTVSDTARQTCEGVDLLITATSSTEPLVDAAWLAPGVHITAVGADDPAKVELAPACIARADRVVVDSRALAEVHGDLAHAAGTAGIRPRQTPAELGELLVTKVGRKSDEEITICKLIGLGVQDLAAAEVTITRLETATTAARPPASANDLRRTPA
jgi:ornithine cyclodeaminase